MSATLNPKEQIVDYLPEMRAFALSLTRNPTSADDLVQDSLIKAWKNFHQFQADTNLRAWLFTIVRNTFYSDMRKRKREFDCVDEAEVDLINTGQNADAVIEAMDFERAFSMLPDQQREALTLVGASGMSYDEAAELCGVAIGTIKSRINRARKKLAELLDYDVMDRPA